MKNIYLTTIVTSIFLMSVAGCSQQPKAADSQQAIEQSKSMGTVEAQTKYLIDQANAFVNSKDFDQAIQTAKHVLANLDTNSMEAKSVIEKATEEMKKMAQQKAEELKKSLGALGK